MIEKTLKHTGREALTCLAAIYIALIAFLSLNLHGGRITESIEKSNSIIIVALLLAVVLRIVKKNILTAVLTIVAEVTLIRLTVETIIADNLWDTLKNFVVEPGISLAMICIILLVLNWLKLVGTLQRGNTVQP